MSGPARVRALLDGLPRHRLAHLPTPIEPMARLSAAVGGPELWIKRDDLTGLALGGNKARQLEFPFGTALAGGADTVVITSAVQSNYVRSAAAAAAKLGMACHVQLEDRVKDMDGDYHRNGNVLLDRIYGAVIHHFPLGEDEAAADAGLSRIARNLAAEGRRPYVMSPSTDGPPLTALGYVLAAAELLEQIADAGLALDALVVPSGSAATHAGILTGLRLAGSSLPVRGICVRRAAGLQQERVRGVCGRIENLLGAERVVQPDDVICHDDWLGPGYGQLADSTREAITLAGRLEGMVVDPVYTAKSLAGVIGLSRQGTFAAGQRVMFLHTGGQPAVFAYAGLLFPDP